MNHIDLGKTPVRLNCELQHLITNPLENTKTISRAD